MAVIPANLNKLRRDILGISGAYAWWPMDADRLTVGGGLIQVASDLVAGRALTFAVGQRPAYITTDPLKPCARFAGAEMGQDAGGLLTGLGGASLFFVWKQGTITASYEWLCVVGPTTPGSQDGRIEMFLNPTSGVPNVRAEHAAGTYMTATETAAFDGAWHAEVVRWKFSDGSTACKAIRQDGSNLALAANSGDVTGGTICNGTISVGGWGGYVAYGDLSDILVCQYLDDATADIVQQCFQSLRGTP